MRRTPGALAPLVSCPQVPATALAATAVLLAAAIAAAAPAAVPAPSASPAPPAPPVVHHAARVRLDPRTSLLAVQDTLTVPAGLDSFTVLAALSPGAAAGASAAIGEETVDVGSDPDRRTEAVPPGAELLPDGSRRFVVSYAGRPHQATEGAVFSRERVGGEISATVGPEGVFLSSRACWLPTFPGALATHRLAIEAPPGLIPVTNGVRGPAAAGDDGLQVTTYLSPQPSDGLDLVAGRYEVTERAHQGVTIATYLLQPDSSLGELYLERTGHYLDMYTELFGPYPFGKFATVENWFPTGYGMPGWTLLGGMVMRLPHIPYTSFGHEVCHNWWGNSVLVGEGGNWCEGLTTYWADYHYEEIKGEEAARAYRRNLLKDYAAYVSNAAAAGGAEAAGGARDFPLAEFTSRHSGASRAVGYGKSMMVWHMLDRLAGRERFLNALRRVYAQKLFQPAAWDDFLRQIEGECGHDLAAFRAQWLERAGAPALRLESAERKGDKVRIRLAQDEPAYLLHVPVVVSGPAGSREETVVLSGPRGEFSLEGPDATRVAVDPDYHLFRRLDPLEIEPTISEVLAAAVPLFVLPAAASPADSAMAAAALAFARAWSESEAPMTARGGRPPADTEAANLPSMILLNPEPDFLKAVLPPDVAVSGDTAIIGGLRHDLRERDLVLAIRYPATRPATDLVVISRSPDRLAGLGRRVVHYGKYSWLSLPAGRGDVQRGNWAPPGDPLARELR